MRRLVWLLLGPLLALVACAAPAADGDTRGSTTAPRAWCPGSTSLAVPELGVESSLPPLGLQPDGTMQVPPVQQPMQAGWYRHSPQPGDTGPSIIAGHVDGGGKPGVFHRLHTLTRGDEVHVECGPTGERRVFTVREVVTVPKDAFPWQRVVADTLDPQLRLITCGGPFVGGDLGYSHNVIVFARVDQRHI